MQHFLGHGVRECGAIGEAARQRLRLAKHRLRGSDAVEKTPRESLVRGHDATRVEKLGGAPLPDRARQERTGAHVAPGEADANEQEGGPRGGRADAKIGGKRDHRARAGAYAVHRRHDRLRAMTHRLHQVARHAREILQFRRAHARERSDDVVHVAAGAEVSTGPRDHDGFDVARQRKRAKQVAEFRIRLEGQGILALGPR